MFTQAIIKLYLESTFQVDNVNVYIMIKLKLTGYNLLQNENNLMERYQNNVVTAQFYLPVIYNI